VKLSWRWTGECFGRQCTTAAVRGVCAVITRRRASVHSSRCVVVVVRYVRHTVWRRLKPIVALPTTTTWHCPLLLCVCCTSECESFDPPTTCFEPPTRNGVCGQLLPISLKPHITPTIHPSIAAPRTQVGRVMVTAPFSFCIDLSVTVDHATPSRTCSFDQPPSLVVTDGLTTARHSHHY